MLPPFDENATTELSNAKQDKIDITIGEWGVVGDDHDASSLLSELSTVPIPSADNHNDQTWFNAYQGFRYGRGEIRFSGRGQGGRRVEGVPLLSGVLQARRHGIRDDHSPSAFLIKATLSINPTRFVRHRGSTLKTHLGPVQWADGIDPLLLTSRRWQSRNQNEISLDGNDNVIMTQRANYASRPEVWPHQLRLYWQNIQSFLDNLIMSRADPIGVLANRQRTEINLRTVETYWEYETDDALHAISMLVPTMQSLGREASIRTYPIADECMAGNSLSVRIRLSTSVTCTFYAKTTKRVRLEIKHYLTEQAGVIGGSHTSTDPDDLLAWLDTIAQDAAQRGNQVLQHITSELSNNVPQRPVYELLSHVAAVSEDQAVNDHLVSVLVNTRRFELQQNHDPFRPAITQLVQAGVLQRAIRYSQIFVISPQYGWALAELRGMRRRRQY